MCKFEQSITWDTQGKGQFAPLTKETLAVINDKNIYVVSNARKNPVRNLVICK